MSHGHSPPGSIRSWFCASRPRTLTIAAVPVLVGATLAWADHGALSLGVLVATLGAAVLIQIGTNLHNDAADFERGLDDPHTRLGPPRASAQGWLRARDVRTGAHLCFAAAATLGGYLIYVGGWPILAIGVTAIGAGLAYSGGPHPISFSGTGELFVWSYFGLFAVAGTYYLQAEAFSAVAWLAGAAVGMPAAAVLVANNYRDIEGDRRAGRRTLAVQLGERVSRYEYAGLMLSGFVLLPLIQSGETGPWGWLPWASLPWAMYLIHRFWRQAPGPALNPLLAATAGFQLVFALLLCTGVAAPVVGAGDL